MEISVAVGDENLAAVGDATLAAVGAKRLAAVGAKRLTAAAAALSRSVQERLLLRHFLWLLVLSKACYPPLQETIHSVARAREDAAAATAEVLSAVLSNPTLPPSPAPDNSTV